MSLTLKSLAYRQAQNRAAELVAGWPLETLHSPDAEARLVSSWGLQPADARSIVVGARSRRPA